MKAGSGRKVRGADVEERFRAQRRILAERVKELECLFTVSRIFNQPGLSFATVLSRLCQAIQAAWQYPKLTCARIVARREEAHTANFRETRRRLRAVLRRSRGERLGSIEVCFLGDVPDGGDDAFLPTERKLLGAIAELTANMIVRKDAEREIRRTSSRLQEEKRRLERKNIALKEVLAQIEIEKKEIRDQVALNIRSSILPILHKLRTRGMSDEQRDRYVTIIERDLAGIGSSVSSTFASVRPSLSPREVEVADLARGGASSKEIARLLHVSEQTVERHRHNIRRKAGIAGRKVNLVTFLNEGQQEALRPDMAVPTSPGR